MTKLMFESFLSYITDKKLVFEGDKVLLAVSGGIDSMVMAHLFKRMHINIGVAHVNHNLRGAAALEDAAFVKNFASQYGLPYFQHDIDPVNLSGGNVQEKARMIRYKWLYEIADAYHYDKIATAHHQDDMIETFFIHLIRGSGLLGLSSINVSHDIVIRPIIFATRKEIAAYCQTHQILYREDSSNKSVKYLRNRLRHEVLPDFYNADHRAHGGILSSIEKLSATQQLLDFLIDKVSSSIMAQTTSYKIIRLAEFAPSTVHEQWLFQLVRKFGFNMDQVKEILHTKRNTGNHFMSESHEAIIDRANLLIRQKIQTCPVEEQIQIKALPFEYKRDSFIIRISEEKREKVTQNGDRQVMYISADHLYGNITLRSVRPGDRYQPEGMGGQSQKLKDFFINHKINIFDKEKMVVLTHEDMIIAIPGFRKSHLVSIKPETEVIWKIVTEKL